jgi:MSHA biogenesis protein MshK
VSEKYKVNSVLFTVILGLIVHVKASGNDIIRDPTRPIAFLDVSKIESKFGGANIVLHSIVSGQGRKQAVINGYRLNEGDLLPNSDGIRLNKIFSDAVQLKKNDRIWTVSMIPSVIKKN